MMKTMSDSQQKQCDCCSSKKKKLSTLYSSQNEITISHQTNAEKLAQINSVRISVGDAACFFTEEAVRTVWRCTQSKAGSLTSLSLAWFSLHCAGIYFRNMVQLTARFCNLRQLKRSIRRIYPAINFNSIKSLITNRWKRIMIIINCAFS